MRSQLGQQPERLLGLDLGLPVLEDARAGGLRLRAVREAVDRGEVARARYRAWRRLLNAED